MGRGTDAARLLNPEHAKLIDDLKEQLLIVFLKRLGGAVTIPVAEVDDTGRDVFALSVVEHKEHGYVFHFAVQPKPGAEPVARHEIPDADGGL